MPLDRPALATALEAAFQQGMDTPDWTLAQAAGAMADAIDAYVRTADVTGITTDVVDLGSNPIGTGAQTGTGEPRMTDPVRGPALPFEIDPATGGVVMEDGDRKLADNIRTILAMRLGERPMARNFGTPIRSLVHEPNDGGLARLITRYARETLAQLEPRIRVADVRFHSKGGEAVLELRYLPADRPDAQLLLIPVG